MRRASAVFGVLVGACTLAAVAGATGRGDSVVGSIGIPDQLIVSLSVHSGAAGEDAFGMVNLRGQALPAGVSKVEVTCLDVHGNQAGLTGPVSPALPIRDTGYYIIGVYIIAIDDGPAASHSTRDGLGLALFSSTDPNQTLQRDTCDTTALPPPPFVKVTQGNVNVHDETP